MERFTGLGEDLFLIILPQGVFVILFFVLLFFFFFQIRKIKDIFMDNYSKMLSRYFSGDAVDKTPCSQCRGPGFDPWSGN